MALSPECAYTVMSYLGCGRALAACEQVSGVWQEASLFADQHLWKQLCERHHIKQTGTRTRGRLGWKELYVKHTCVECAEPATRVFSAQHASGDTKVPLCKTCAAKDFRQPRNFPRVSKDEWAYHNLRAALLRFQGIKKRPMLVKRPRTSSSSGSKTDRG
ncbi:unnamed protein product [Vitrella brassicaformis CCMP3155]|uniref:F-box domain-containing protein n=2 Tax=Vitrella brassicaformis TaxID=1169539 RepID=A0A0G4EB93_VITBC|nr:unnamed protein product [Vitrella brassicaformis CCMP3155]|mmetsp:Transcript_24510/g.60562  ORF Transcript_24510/g.60562 Transcript_24510/m.60562 type:complete len:160 (+) Transcript_24510:202-681(+)|eukprot:CEL92967.1 unnamed protein product [Vitrella brassicaformis CCMP3155]